METSGGIRASLAGRYASALFDLARDERQIDAVGRSLDALGQALLDSKDFAELVASPLVGREEAGKAFAALAPQLGLDPITTNFLGVLAQQRPQERSFAPSSAPSAGSPPSIAARRPPKSSPRGRSTTTRSPRSRQQLRARAGRDVTIDAQVDPDILGGIVVKLGSQHDRRLDPHQTQPSRIRR